MAESSLLDAALAQAISIALPCHRDIWLHRRTAGA